MTAVLNIADLIAGDNAAEYRRLPIIVGSNRCSTSIVQFHSWIIQSIGNPILRELRTNGTNDHPLWSRRFDEKTANHHMLACLTIAARADVTETCVRLHR